MASVSRHIPIAGFGLAVLLAAILTPFPPGNGERTREVEADRLPATIMTAGPEAPAWFVQSPSVDSGAPEPASLSAASDAHKPAPAALLEPAPAASQEPALAASREPELAASQELALAASQAPAPAASPEASPLAAIGDLVGAAEPASPLTIASANTQVALATPYAEPEAPASRPLPNLIAPSPPAADADAPLEAPLRASLEPVHVMPGDWDPAFAPLPASIAPPDADTAKRAISAYGKGDMALGDAFAAMATTESARVALEWVAIRTDSHGTGFRRIAAFLKAHPDWPSAPWLRRRSEEALYADRQGFGLLAAYFSKAKPESAPGKLALARLYRNQGRIEDATALVRDVWREGEFGQALESKVVEEFGDLLTSADHKFRADRAFYKEDAGRLMRAPRTREATRSRSPRRRPRSSTGRAIPRRCSLRCRRRSRPIRPSSSRVSSCCGARKSRTSSSRPPS